MAQRRKSQHSVRPPASSLPASRLPTGERRHLTVMFCDLVGSTPLAEKLDPEELHEVVQAYHELCATVIHRFGGYLAQYIGDGVVVYFGYPAAHEDDVQRAVRAGLEIVAELRALNTRLQPHLRVLREVPLQLRIGIHTGLVVVGEMGRGARRDLLALGETPNLAARLQALAEPDTVVISAATQRLIAGLFECRSLGLHAPKGLTVPLQVYQVLAESEMQSRFELAVRMGLTPLVGREHEVGLLRDRWEQAKEGAGQVVLLNGEPGIGKSRLVQELKEHTSAENATRIEFRCSPYHQHSAFYPIVEHLQRFLQFAFHEPPQTKLTKLQQTLARYRFPQSDTLPLLTALLSLPHPEGVPLLTLSPQKQKQRTQEALLAWIVEEADRQAVYCACEDLQWADPSTVELLTLFLDRVPTTRVLALLTFRPDFIPPWRPHSHITHLTLSRLGRPWVEAMVEQVTGGKTLPPEVLQQIVSKTDGVPLFVEELTKMVVESGLVREQEGRYVGTHGGVLIPPLAIPATLQDSLMARLDRLAPVREIAQVGAVLGREFSYELLHAVSPLDEAVLQQGLGQLVEAELIYQRGLPPQAAYLFKHALIQDTAYQSLLKSKRQQLHQQIAHVLAERFPETVAAQPELLAHHYTEAGVREEALRYWQQAGQRAIERSANEEAIRHLTHALALLETFPDTPERAQHELALQVLRGTPLLMARGYAAPEVESAYARARALCQRLEAGPQLLPALAVLVRFHVARAELGTARELGEQTLRLAEGGSELFVLIAHALLGITFVRLGEFTTARKHLEQGIALYDAQKHRSLASLYGQDPGVACLSTAAGALWLLGYPDQALGKSQEALTLAQGLTLPFPQALALELAAWSHLHRGEGEAAQQYARALVALATEQGFPFWAAEGAVIQGWALATLGQKEEGIAQMRQGLAASRATGAEMARPTYLAHLAGAYGEAGRAAEGLPVLAEALTVVERTGERIYEAELHRLEGTLTLQARPHPLQANVAAQAEACFHQAIIIAQRQRAKSLELRAVMSLSRLWQQQGKQHEAHKLLSEIYSWFTEGFDTKDLQEAKALLEELQ